MKIEVYKTKVKIIVSNKNIDRNIDCINCCGLVIDYSEEKDYYTVEFEYVAKNEFLLIE